MDRKGRSAVGEACSVKKELIDSPVELPAVRPLILTKKPSAGSGQLMFWPLAFLSNLKRFSNKCTNTLILLYFWAEDNRTNFFDIWFPIIIQHTFIYFNI